MYAFSLLDKAKAITGSDAKTADLAGVSRQTLNKVRHREKKLSPELAAIIAALIGDDPDYAVKRVMIENAEGDMLTRLQRAFRVAAGVVGVAVLVALGSAPSPVNAGTIKTDRDGNHVTQRMTLYTLWLVFVRVYRSTWRAAAELARMTRRRRHTDAQASGRPSTKRASFASETVTLRAVPA